MLVASAPADATFPGPNGRISFTSDRAGPRGSFQLFSARPDGSGLMRLTHTRPGTSSIVSDWSPDGQLLVFDSDRTGDVEVFRMWPVGSHVRRLTQRDGFDGDPSFSPDGRRIVFDRAGAGERTHTDLWTMDLRGGDLRRVTHTHGVDEIAPAYSPDGRWIAFWSFNRAGTPSVYLVHPDGSDRHRLTPLRLRAASPDWSPDGTRIAFESNIDVPHSSIFTIRPDGTGLRRLTSGPRRLNDFDPSYSPSGRKIAFASDRGNARGNPDIWIMNADGSGLHRLTRTPAAEFAPDWGTHRG